MIDNLKVVMDVTKIGQTKYVPVDGQEMDHNLIINDIDILDNHRFSSYLNETELATRLNLNYTLKKVRFDVGYDYKNKVRDFDYEQTIYNFDNANLMNDINNPDYNLESNSQSIKIINPASKYDASVKIHSTYILLGYKSDKFVFMVVFSLKIKND